MSLPTCAAPGCTKIISPTKLCCGRHWFSLPAELRTRLTAAYTEFRAARLPHQSNPRSSDFATRFFAAREIYAVTRAEVVAHLTPATAERAPRPVPPHRSA